MIMAAGNKTYVGMINEQYVEFTGRKISLLLFLFPLILLVAGIATTLGSAEISIGEAYTALFYKFFPEFNDKRGNKSN